VVVEQTHTTDLEVMKMTDITEPIKLTSDNFDSVLKEHPYVLVDGWASWCMPCLMVAPVIEELACEMDGKVVFGKLNVDENPQIATSLGMSSIPSLLLFKDGKLLKWTVGAMPKEVLKDWLEKNMA